MSKLKKPYYRKTEVGIGVIIRRNTPRGKGRILSFSKPVREIELSEYDAHTIAWYLDPRTKREETGRGT